MAKITYVHSYYHPAVFKQSPEELSAQAKFELKLTQPIRYGFLQEGGDGDQIDSTTGGYFNI